MVNINVVFDFRFKKKNLRRWDGSVGCGFYVVGGWVYYSDNNATSWLHLASWNLPDSQLSWESKMEPSVAKSCTVWGASAAYCFHPSQDLDRDRIKQFNLTGVAGKAELSSICYKVSSPPVLGWWSDLHILPMSVGEGKIPIRALQEYKPDCLRKVHIRACNYKHILNFILAPSSLQLKELFLGS